MATSVSFLPGITPEDKLRLAASKGQLDKVKEFIISGASFDPDKVRINLSKYFTAQKNNVFMAET